MSRFLEKWLRRREGGAKNARAALIALIVLAALALISIVTRLSGIGAALGELSMYMGYAFMRRALIVGILVALCAALLGVTLVLKDYSMIGDGLSHVGFGALSIASALGFVRADALPAFLPEGLRVAVEHLCAAISASPLPFTLLIVIVLAVLILRLNERSSLRGDAAIAMLSTGALAVGVLVTSVGNGLNTDLMNYMFGSILAMSDADVYLSVSLSLIVLALFVLFYNRIFAVTFDERFARATGTKVDSLNLLIAVLTAVTIVVGMRMMGTMLISSLIIFPALTSMRVFSRFRSVVICSAIVSVSCFVAGILLSCLRSIPVGAAIVVVNIVVFIVFSLIGTARGR